MHLRYLGLALIPLVAACDEDDNGLGIGQPEDSFRATLSGANVRPVGSSSSATGTATFSVREPSIGSTVRVLSYTITVAGLTSATTAHLHLGGPAVANGQILATLFSNPVDTAITSAQLVTGTILEANLAISLDSLVALMRSGNAYVDIHTTGNTEGVVRGQITRPGGTLPAELFAAPTLNGASERPTPVATTASGSATFEVVGGNSIRFSLRVVGLTGATQAHIHHGVADSAGPILVSLLSSATPTGPFTGTLATGTFTASSIETGISLDSLLALMRRGRTYVDVHTSTNATGEIRGQIAPVTVLP